MSFQSLVVHNGVTHQKSNSVEHPKQLTTETKTNREPNANSQTVVHKDNITSEKQVIATPGNKTEN